MNILACFFFCSGLIQIYASKISELNEVHQHLGTRTPYRLKYNKDESKIRYPGCKSTKIWMVIRHGTRLPSRSDIMKMNKTLTALKYEILLQQKLGSGELTQEQLNEFEDWSTNLDPDEEKFLTEEGRYEMVQLGDRTLHRFSDFLKNNYNNKTYQFRYTATQRAQQSAKYFTIGLFNAKESQNVLYAPAKKVDPILRFYKHCDKWLKQVKRNKETYNEQQVFANSQQMLESLRLISKRLGLTKLDVEKAILMYKTCGFETAWSKYHNSPWCYAFDKKSVLAMEYYFELKNFYLDGYGHDLTQQIACLPIKDMINHFTIKKGAKATFLFTHSGTLLKILAYLQLYKPETKLPGSHIEEKRPWRLTDIDCFASNLAFVLYECESGPHVVTLHQERVIKLPMCEDELCPLKNILEYFKGSLDNCDYDDMCGVNESEHDSNSDSDD